jgi:hypothetical protein
MLIDHDVAASVQLDPSLRQVEVAGDRRAAGGDEQLLRPQLSAVGQGEDDGAAARLAPHGGGPRR